MARNLFATNGVRAAAVAMVVASGMSGAGEAAFVNYSVVATPVTSGGLSLVRYELFANFNGATDTVLSVLNFQASGGWAAHTDAAAGFWHKDLSDSNSGILSQQFGTWAPNMIGSTTLNRPFDSFLLIGGTPASTNTTTAGTSWNGGGANPTGWTMAQIPLYNDLGWFNASPPNLQGRVGTPPNTATQVKIGQFMLSANDTAYRTYTLRIGIAVNIGGTGSNTVFSDASFTFFPELTWFRDLDSDGFGSASSGTLLQFGQPAGYVLSNTDCNDTNAAINPNTIWRRDLDADGFGSASNGTLTQCLQPAGYVLSNTDCNDSNAAINPNTIWHRDLDADGFGFASDGTLTQCLQPAGYVFNNSDNCPSIANPLQEDCNSNSVGDVCEIAVGSLFDCDSDGRPDICDGAVIIAATSGLLAPLSGAASINYLFTALPRAYAGTPQLTIDVTADLGSATDGIFVSIDGGSAFPLFGSDGTDCPATPDRSIRSFTLPAFNALVSDGELRVQITTYGSVNSATCTNGGVRLALGYAGLPSASDCNNNGRPDTCDIALGSSSDLDANGLPDDCSSEFIVGGSGYATIQSAINAAPNYATILVAPNTYAPFDLSGKAVTIASLGSASNSFIDGVNLARCITMTSPAASATIVQGFTIQNGLATDGGGVLIENAGLSLRDCVIRNNTASDAGGGVACISSAMILVNCTFTNNIGARGGAVYLENVVGQNVGVIRDCTIFENTSGSAGGAIHNQGRLYLKNTIIERNDAAVFSGGLWSGPRAVADLESSRFCDNLPSNIAGPWEAITPNIFSQDCDADGLCDYDEILSGAELDCTANGFPDDCDISSGASLDCNANGIPDSCDLLSGAPDCNANGIPDSCDLASGFALDCNANTIPDLCDISTGESSDIDSNGIPDECKPDCDGDGIPDAWELSQGIEPDCNNNGMIDRCDTAANPALDCNGNNVPDSCDLLENPKLDCDNDGQFDSCEIILNPSLDCNTNTRLDACDIADNALLDCDNSGTIDTCDITAGADDKNSNGHLDSCELNRGDMNLDGIVSAPDLALLLNFWGFVNPPVADLNQDGVVNAADLTALLGNWGTVP